VWIEHFEASEELQESSEEPDADSPVDIQRNGEDEQNDHQLLVYSESSVEDQVPLLGK